MKIVGNVIVGVAVLFLGILVWNFMGGGEKAFTRADIPAWYDTEYNITDLRSWRRTPTNQRKSFCLDCLSKIRGELDVKTALLYESEITECSGISKLMDTEVREIVAFLLAWESKGGNIEEASNLLGKFAGHNAD